MYRILVATFFLALAVTFLPLLPVVVFAWWWLASTGTKVADYYGQRALGRAEADLERRMKAASSL